MSLAEEVRKTKNTRENEKINKIQENIKSQMGKDIQLFFDSLKKYCVEQGSVQVSIFYTRTFFTNKAKVSDEYLFHNQLMRELLQNYWLGAYEFFFDTMEELAKRNEFELSFDFYDTFGAYDELIFTVSEW